MGLAIVIAGGGLAFGLWQVSRSSPGDHDFALRVTWMGFALGLLIGIGLAMLLVQRSRAGKTSWRPTLPLITAVGIGMAVNTFLPPFGVGAFITTLGAFLGGMAVMGTVIAIIGRRQQR